MRKFLDFLHICYTIVSIHCDSLTTDHLIFTSDYGSVPLKNCLIQQKKKRNHPFLKISQWTVWANKPHGLSEPLHTQCKICLWITTLKSLFETNKKEIWKWIKVSRERTKFKILHRDGTRALWKIVLDRKQIGPVKGRRETCGPWKKKNLLFNNNFVSTSR